MEKIITSTAEIFMDEHCILHEKRVAGPQMDLGDAVDNFVVGKNLAQQKPVLKLLDTREKRSISAGARKFIKKGNTAENHIAKAIVVNSLLTKYLQDFSGSLFHPGFPVKSFTSERAAVEWLKTFL